MKKYILEVAVYFYLLGYMIFPTFVTFTDSGTSVSNVSYFLWQGIGYGSLLQWLVIYFMGDNEVKKTIQWCLGVSALKIVWEIVSICRGIDINNDHAELIFVAISSLAAFVLTSWDMMKKAIIFFWHEVRFYFRK